MKQEHFEYYILKLQRLPPDLRKFDLLLSKRDTYEWFIERELLEITFIIAVLNEVGLHGLYTP